MAPKSCEPPDIAWARVCTRLAPKNTAIPRAISKPTTHIHIDQLRRRSRWSNAAANPLVVVMRYASSHLRTSFSASSPCALANFTDSSPCALVHFTESNASFAYLFILRQFSSHSATMPTTLFLASVRPCKSKGKFSAAAVASFISLIWPASASLSGTSCSISAFIARRRLASWYGRLLLSESFSHAKSGLSTLSNQLIVPM